MSSNLFMQNKPNFTEAKMNSTSITTRCYEDLYPQDHIQNKPNQTQFQTQPAFCKFFLFFTSLCPSYNLAMQNWTIQKLLNWITEYFTDKALDSPRLNGELLLSYVLGLQRIELYTNFDSIVSEENLERLHELVKRCAEHEPAEYLTGKTQFFSLEFKVTPDCLIPRPETELLAERAIEFLRKRTGRQYVCDLCTGCGCIAVAIAKNFADAEIIATDISDAALKIAAENVKTHNLTERIKLLRGNLFEPIISGLDAAQFDLIVCNPPYVSSAEFEALDKKVKDYEPKTALFAEANGLDVYRRITQRVDSFLKPDGALMLEIGYAQGPAVKQLLEQTGCFAELIIKKDFNNNDRVVIARKTLS